MTAASSNTSGSFSLSHSALGTIHSALTGPAPPPFTASASSPQAATRAACPADRMSIHSSAGRSALPTASRATTVQQVVSTQSAATSEGAMPADAMAARTATPRPAHQSAGSCSPRGRGGWIHQQKSTQVGM